MNLSELHNPHLDGEAFFWEGGPTGILLIHGLTATAREVRPFARQLHAVGYTVAGPLLAGHGTSPENLRQTPWQDWVESAEETYRQLKNKCTTVMIAGESAGGVIALYLANLHPEIPLILTYAPAIHLNITPIRNAFLHTLAPVLKFIPKGGLDSSTNWQGYRVNPLKAGIQLEHLQKEVLRFLPEIRQPVLVIQGRHDRTIDPRSGEIILARIGSPIKELHWMENSAHCVLLDREMDQILRITLEFIQKNFLAK